MNRFGFTLLGFLLCAMLYLNFNSANSLHPLTPLDLTGYHSDWKDLLSHVFQPASLDKINANIEKARKEGNVYQLAKGLVYRSLYRAWHDNDYAGAINQLEKEVGSFEFPVRPFLQAVLANQYRQYYSENRYKMRGRTETAGDDITDVAVMGPKNLLRKISRLYQAALESADSLQHTPLNVGKAFLSIDAESSPTLYDFIAKRALEFYSEESGQESSFDDVKALLPLNDFIHTKFSSTDDDDFAFLAILLHQALLQFHSKDASAERLIEMDLNRLNFASRFVSDPDGTLYIDALKNLEESAQYHPASATVSAMLASHYFGKQDRKKALRICERTIKRFPKTRGAYDCRYLRRNILEKHLNVQVENSIEPQKPFRMYVSYANLKKIYFRIIKTDFEKLRKLEFEKDDQDSFLIDLKNLPALSAWGQELPEVSDYAIHGVEIKAPSLERGSYAVLASEREDFAVDKNGIVLTRFWVTNLTLLDEERSLLCYVLNARTGEPVENAEVESFSEVFNYEKRKYSMVPSRSYTTDRDGQFEMKETDPNNRYLSYLVQLNDDSEHFFPVQRFKANDLRGSSSNLDDLLGQIGGLGESSETASKSEKILMPGVRTEFFTDRSIYRPGQKIYFKGIMFHSSKDDTKHEVVAGKKTFVRFLDANWQKITEQECKTNEFGSFSGEFTAPAGVLNGQMRIENKYGSVSLSVEEYKRPKFEVAFKPVTESYRLGETVKVHGSAKSFSGAVVDHADVRYRIKRRSPNNWFDWGYSSSPEKEIAHGKVKTNEEGEFAISFTAEPDKRMSNEPGRAYEYTIAADVTDINGETQSGHTGVRVSYTTLLAGMDIPEFVNKDKDFTLTIRTNNINGEFEPARGIVTIEEMTQSEKTYRSRAWPKPDQFIITKDEFEREFPYDAYSDEVDKLSKRTTVYTQEVDTKEKKTLLMNTFRSLNSGRYAATFRTKDRLGNEVRTENLFTLYSENDSHPALKKNLYFVPVKTDCEPGESARFICGSTDPSAHVLYEIEHRGKMVHREWLTFENSQKILTFPINEEHRGGVSVHFTMVSNYRFSSQTSNISVPWTNKQLKLEFATFRDKLLPGAREQWTITVSGTAADRLNSEMVATLYDASLDQFRGHHWGLDLMPTFSARQYVGNGNAFSAARGRSFEWDWNQYEEIPSFQEEISEKDEDSAPVKVTRGSGGASKAGRVAAAKAAAGARAGKAAKSAAGRGVLAIAGAVGGAGKYADVDFGGSSEKTVLGAGGVVGGSAGSADESEAEDLGEVKARANLDETAFFYPHLRTNARGEIVISFSIPEALTRWRMMGFAHTKTMSTGFVQNSLVTQKEIMVQNNAPRFLREGDEIYFAAKVSNISDNAMRGKAQLFLFNAATMKPVDAAFENKDAQKSFDISKGESAAMNWRLKIPRGVEAVLYRVVAKSGNASDGEETAMPVLPDRMLVTESLPLPIRGKQTKSFELTKLLHANESSTLRHYRLTLEMTSNPAWYAIQALPYLIEYPYECAEQLFSRFYANSLATHMANSRPKIKAVFDRWKNSSALLSNLEKNQELKSALLEETPWVLEAQDESLRKKHIGLLLDLNTMSQSLSEALKKLKDMQMYNGAWPWFAGMPEDRFITQYITTGFGHLKRLGVKFGESEVNTMITRAVGFLDAKVTQDYKYLKDMNLDLNEDHIGNFMIQYLYARSYFMDQKIDESHREAFDYWKSQAQKYWKDRNSMTQAMAALALYRLKDTETPAAILKAIKDRSMESEELGMYWKGNSGGYYWYEDPIETQAMLIEAFDEVLNDKASVESMQVWLLKQKQVRDWKTTKATAEACYALLLRGTDMLASDEVVEVKVGDHWNSSKKIKRSDLEAGTGYFKTAWTGDEIKSDMGKVTLTKNNDGVAWGGLHWQYYEQLDKITPHETPLVLKKKVFVQRTTDKGIVIEPVGENSDLKVGDLLKIRLELRVDRDMEYIHMKDMRAAGTEPTNVISRYKYQDGLGYYESTKDASTNFFISYLGKGTYVFEYPLRITHEGDFQNGITTIQSMYAPEFNSHSEGVRLKVGKAAQTLSSR